MRDLGYEHASYQGKFIKFSGIIANPKPIQKPHPPIIVGGAFPYGARRAIAYGDGWIPHAKRPAYDSVIDKVSEFRKMAKLAGRNPDSLPITVLGWKMISLHCHDIETPAFRELYFLYHRVPKKIFFCYWISMRH